VSVFAWQVVEEENPVEIGCFEQLDNFPMLSELEWSGTAIDDSHIKVLSKIPLVSARFNLSDQLRGYKFGDFPFSTLESTFEKFGFQEFFTQNLISFCFQIWTFLNVSNLLMTHFLKMCVLRCKKLKASTSSVVIV